MGRFFMSLLSTWAAAAALAPNLQPQPSAAQRGRLARQHAGFQPREEPFRVRAKVRCSAPHCAHLRHQSHRLSARLYSRRRDYMAGHWGPKLDRGGRFCGLRKDGNYCGGQRVHVHCARANVPSASITSRITTSPLLGTRRLRIVPCGPLGSASSQRETSQTRYGSWTTRRSLRAKIRRSASLLRPHSGHRRSRMSTGSSSTRFKSMIFPRSLQLRAVFTRASSHSRCPTSKTSRSD